MGCPGAVTPPCERGKIGYMAVDPLAYSQPLLKQVVIKAAFMLQQTRNKLQE